jgi:hypothetical protein
MPMKNTSEICCDYWDLFGLGLDLGIGLNWYWLSRPPCLWKTLHGFLTCCWSTLFLIAWRNMNRWIDFLSSLVRYIKGENKKNLFWLLKIKWDFFQSFKEQLMMKIFNLFTWIWFALFLNGTLFKFCGVFWVNTTNEREWFVEFCRCCQMHKIKFGRKMLKM